MKIFSNLIKKHNLNTQDAFFIVLIATSILVGGAKIFIKNAHAGNPNTSPIHQKLIDLDKTPIQSTEGKSQYKAIYAICKNPSNGANTMYRVTSIRPHYRGNSKATLTLFNGTSKDVFLDQCQTVKIA